MPTPRSSRRTHPKSHKGKRRAGILLRAGRLGARSLRGTPARLIIAIDGPAGSGKSTTARALAKRLNIPYIDSGAMYRAVTLKAMRQNVALTDVKRLAAIAKNIRIRFGAVGAGFKPAPTSQCVFMDGKDVTRAIRTPELTKNVFYIAREPRVRKQMVKKQRLLARKHGAVMEGRDIGTVVFPGADYKFYFRASREIRAKRRLRDIVQARRAGLPAGQAGAAPSLAQVRKDIDRRDRSDRGRKVGALKVARGARVLDTTGLTIGATVDRILAILKGSA